MTVALSPRAARLAQELALPMTAALLVTGIVRLLLSVKASCDVLQCDDFGRFWYATSAWWSHGTSLYSLTPASVSDDGLAYLNLNLPHTHLLFLPFIALPLRAAAAAWLITGLSALALSLWIVRREVKWQMTSLWLLVAVWWMPNHMQAVTGQLAWMLLVPLTLSWSAARRERWSEAGVWLGVAIAVKPFLLPLLAWMLWRGQFRGVLWSTGVALAIVCAGVAIFGVGQYQQWRETIGGVQWYGRPLNASVWGMVFRAFSPNNRTAIVMDLGGWVGALSIAASGLVALTTWLACRSLTSIDDQWSAVLCATLLVCPLGWVDHGVPPHSRVARSLARRHRHGVLAGADAMADPRAALRARHAAVGVRRDVGPPVRVGPIDEGIVIADAELRRVLPAAVVDLCGDLIRWTLWALVFVIWVAFLQVYARMIRLTLADPAHSDFTIFYYTARFIADGLPMYGVSPARYGIRWAADHLGNLNPPHFQLLALPLGHLSYGHALGVWIALNLAALVASLVVIARELRIPWAWPRFWLYGAFTLSSAAFTTVAVTCELTFVLMLPFTLAWRAWRNRRWVEAGAWLGACASVKLFLLLFLPWLAWRRRWGALASAAAAVSGLVLAGVAVFGIGAYRDWVHTLGRVGWAWLTMNASWQGFVTRLLHGAPKIAPLVSRPELVAPIALAGSAVIAALTLLMAARRERSPDATVLLLLLGAILASPLGWIYYLPLVYAPILGWMGAGRNWEGLRQLDRPTLVLLATGLALCYVPQETTNAGQPSALASITVGSAYFWGVLAGWLGVLKARHA